MTILVVTPAVLRLRSPWGPLAGPEGEGAKTTGRTGRR